MGFARGTWLAEAALGTWLLTAGVGLARAADLYGGGSDLEVEVRNLLASPDPDKRRQGIEQLAGLDPRVAAPHLLARLRDSDASVRARAARALGPVAQQDAAPQLIACLSDADSGVRSACAESLGQFGALPPGLTGRATATLTRALGDNQYEVRVEALRAIERLLHARVLVLADAQQLLGPVLLRIEDEHVGVRRAAASVLGRMGPLALPAELGRRAVVALLGRLSDSARDVRAEALTSLTALGAAEAAPAALRLLQDPAEDVRRQALLYLGKVAYANAVPLLVETFESGAEALRPAAAQALANLAAASSQAGRGPAAATALAALVGGLAREELRPLGRDALLQVGAAAVPPLLGRLRQGASGQAEVSALVDLLRDLGSDASSAKPQPLPAPLRKQVADALAVELRGGRLPREQIVDALAAQAEPSSAPLLVGLLSDAEVPVRRHAAAGLKQPELLDARALDALTAATRDSDREVRTQATLLLAELPGAAAQPRLLELLRAPDPETRLAATQALGRSAQRREPPPFNASLVTALIGALGQGGDALPELRLRRAAAQTLGLVIAATPSLRAQTVSALLAALRRGRTAEPGHTEIILALAAALRDAPPVAESEAVRKALLDLAQSSADAESPESALALDALDALAALRDPQTAGRIARLLGHREPLRRLHAAAALGSVISAGGSDGSIGALVTALREDGDARVVAEAAWALGKIARGSSLAGRAEAALRQLLERREGAAGAGGSGATAGYERAVRVNTLGALARLAHAEVADAQWLADPDPGVRANAALLLAALVSPSPGMQARLRNIAVTDEDHRVRANAERALRAAGPAAARERRHSLGMYQLDYDHRPLGEVAYRLTLPDGLVRIGTTDRRGIAREEQLPRGSCEVELISDVQ